MKTSVGQVDFGTTLSSRRFTVKEGLDPQLDEMKHIFNGLPDFLVCASPIHVPPCVKSSPLLAKQTGIARDEMATFAQIDECTVVYFPQLGYLLAIPRDNPDDPPLRVPGLQFQA